MVNYVTEIHHSSDNNSKSAALEYINKYKNTIAHVQCTMEQQHDKMKYGYNDKEMWYRLAIIIYM